MATLATDKVRYVGEPVGLVIAEIAQRRKGCGGVGGDRL